MKLALLSVALFGSLSASAQGSQAPPASFLHQRTDLSPITETRPQSLPAAVSLTFDYAPLSGQSLQRGTCNIFFGFGAGPGVKHSSYRFYYEPRTLTLQGRMEGLQALTGFANRFGDQMPSRCVTLYSKAARRIAADIQLDLGSGR